MEEKYEELKSEIFKRLTEYKEKRRDYEKSVRRCNFVLSLCTPATAVIIFVSFYLEEYETFLKGVVLALSVITVLFSYYARNENYGGKLIQRSTTYFALCNLHRKMKYASDKDARYEEFAKEYQEIMENDNRMSLANSVSLVDILQKNYMKGIAKENSFPAAKQKDVENQ